MRNRIFSWIAVVIGVIAVLGFSAAAIIQQIVTPSTDSPISTALACTDSGLEDPLPAPEKYIPAEPVTSLQVTDIQPGTGQAAKVGDCIDVKYYGTLASDGTVFDEHYTTTDGAAIRLEKGSVIDGWVQGIPGMKVGGVRRLVIPASLAYGSSGSGSIPANSALVFYVKLLRIH